MATLTIQKISELGLNPAYSAADVVGDTFQNNSNGNRFVHVKNGGASSITVTVSPAVASISLAGYGVLSKPAVEVAIPASAERMIGPFPFSAFGANPDLQYSAVTSVTIAALTF